MVKKKAITLASGAEDKFIELFTEVFGPDKTGKLLIQYGIQDIYGGNRFIDFAIVTDNEKIAICFHRCHDVNLSIGAGDSGCQGYCS